MTAWDMTFRALPGIPLIQPGDDLPTLITKAARDDQLTLTNGDVITVAQKIVSKAEGRIVRLSDVTPSPRAEKLAHITGRDPRLCQLYLDESKAIIEVRGRHVVTVHRLGFQGTGAGVDMSNVADRAAGYAVLLPEDPDASARRIRSGIRERLTNHGLDATGDRGASPMGPIDRRGYEERIRASRPRRPPAHPRARHTRALGRRKAAHPDAWPAGHPADDQSHHY